VSLNYVVVRLAQIVPTLILIMVVIFVLVRLLPGDPVSAQLGIRATDESVARLTANLGLDKPWPIQFGLFVQNSVTGDFGDSIILKVPVIQLIEERLPVTIFLTVFAALLSVVIAIPMAIISAIKRDSVVDNGIRAAFQVGLSMPIFYIGILLLTFLAAQLRWFPVGGYGNSFLEHLYHLILPALTLAFSLSAVLMRNLRSSIIDVMDAEYVDFARSKGLRNRLILTRHVLRNAFISTVTLFGLNIGFLLGGAVITETVFAIPGIGRLMIDSVYGRDYPVLQGLTMVLAVIVCAVFLITDLVEASLDPRVAQK
jgi:peptide/nickel transport system permease protein